MRPKFILVITNMESGEQHGLQRSGKWKRNLRDLQFFRSLERASKTARSWQKKYSVWNWMVSVQQKVS